MRRVPNNSPGGSHDWSRYGFTYVAGEAGLYCSHCGVSFLHCYGVTPDMDIAMQEAGVSPHCSIESPTKRPNTNSFEPIWVGRPHADEVTMENLDVAIPPAFARPSIDINIVPINIHALMLDPVADLRAYRRATQYALRGKGCLTAPPTEPFGQLRGM